MTELRRRYTSAGRCAISRPSDKIVTPRSGVLDPELPHPLEVVINDPFGLRDGLISGCKRTPQSMCFVLLP